MENHPAVNAILETVFPTRCVGCGATSSWCCEDCLDAIERTAYDPCPRCGHLAQNHDCAHTLKMLDGLIAVGFYHDPILRELIHELKYQHATCLLPSVATILHRFARERVNPWPWAGEQSLGIQAVVGSPTRVKARGFDQAELIRDLVRTECAPWAEVTSLLVRRPSHGTQAELEPGPFRAANVLDAFEAIRGEAAIPGTVILVDDVFTTGATMSQAARALKVAGAKRVIGFALAMGV